MHPCDKNGHTPVPDGDWVVCSVCKKRLYKAARATRKRGGMGA